MSKNRLILVVLTALLGCIYIVGAGESAAAAEGKRKGGITISPAFQEITVDSSKPSATYTFAVTNNTSEPHEFTLSVTDFGSLDESGGVLFMGEAEKQLNYRYGLSSWISLEKDRIVVEPKATEKVRATVINKESLTPGGHYGAILVNPTESGGRPKKVQVNQVLSSLLFVKKEGGEVYNLGLNAFDVQTKLFSAPGSVGLRFQNAGNVHVIPRGTITVTDPMGKVVQRGFINTGSALVLPESFRKLQVPLEQVRASWLPGTYTMGIEYRFDGEDKVETRTIEFVYINGWYVIGLVMLLVLTVGLIFSKRRSPNTPTGMLRPVRHIFRHRRR